MRKLFFKDRLYSIGLLLTALSSLLFLISLSFKNESEQIIGVFFFNHILTIGYWIAVLITAFFYRKTFTFCRFFPGLILSLISAYALNRFVSIFDPSSLWFCFVLVGVCIAYLLLFYIRMLPRWAASLVLAIIGIGSVTFLYLSCYLIPLYPFSVLYGWVLGVPLHAFAPLAFLVFTVIWLFRFIKKERKLWISYTAGVGFVLILITVFTLRWSVTVNQINDTYHETFADDDQALPAWVRVAQRIPKNKVTNKALKIGLTYHVPDFTAHDFLRFRSSSNFTEQNIHDPFIVIACFLSDYPHLESNESVKILESMYDSRHQALDRLWSDEGIETSFVNSSIQIWPQYRMAYTEQVFVVRNTRESWTDGEAVYTFHLPEGSVVTSLSLWINGKEEKGILTTKEKADLAYRTIVGVESRDPSLVHWQEGSTVSVRVFPVNSKEERMFKLGVSSPLLNKGNRLVYQPIYFDGTDFSKAKETLRIQLMQESTDLKYPPFMKKESNTLVSNRRRYNNHWTLSMDEVNISTYPFCFDGHTYTVQPADTMELKVDIRNVYLDLNSSWSKIELEKVCKAVGNKKVWVYHGGEMVLLTDQNKRTVFHSLQEVHFSLFPIHRIPSPNQSLLISKSTSLSPNLNDLKGSSFMNELSSKARPNKAVLFFNLGYELSPYLKTLREYRLLQYKQGTIEDLYTLFQKSTFPYTGKENENSITVHDAGIRIVKQEGGKTSQAPDHIMRLFAYNHIMKQYASSWNSSSPLTDQMVKEAQQAYVVSPVSSLVVLETQQDYDRFDIKETEDNSLKNASKSSKGAVPEPHEWALIALTALVAVFLYQKRKRQVS